jgi:hypothetical protein
MRPLKETYGINDTSQEIPAFTFIFDPNVVCK